MVQLGDVGDLVLTSPFLRELRRSASGEVTLVVKPSVLPLAELCPHADRVLAFDTRRTRVAGALSGVLRARRFARGRLDRPQGTAWNARFDIDELGATFLLLWSGAGRRIGYSERATAAKAVRNRGYDRMLTDPVPVEAGASRHEADRLLALLERDGVAIAGRDLELWLADEDRTAATEALAPAGGGKLVALGVGAGHPKRRWPADRFARLAERLHDSHGATAVLLGSPAEAEIGAEVAARARSPVLDLVGRLGLRGTAAAIARCDLYAGNDSGLMHVAAAAGLPVVEVSCHPRGGDPEHPNSPDRFGPYGVAAAVLRPERPASAECREGCQAGGPHCILGVGVDEVAGAAAAALAGGSG